MKQQKHAILFSSGKESILSLHRLRKRYPTDSITLIHMGYGQMALFRETGAGMHYAKKYNAVYKRLNVDLAIPVTIMAGKYGNNHVYNRNFVFIGMAVNYCLEMGIMDLVVPFTYSQDVNVDSSLQYLAKVRPVIRRLYPGIQLRSNLKNHSEKTHVLLLKEKADLSLVWSCDGLGVWKDGKLYHCGKCKKCYNFLYETPDIKEYLKKVRYAKR